MSRLETIQAKAAMIRAATKAPEPRPSAPTRSVQAKMELVAGNPHFQYAEIERICGLPLVYPMTDEEVEAYSRLHILSDAFAKGFRFFRPQAEIHATFEAVEGCFGEVGVGWGKTLASLMVANIAYRKGHKKILLCIPPNVVPQLQNTDVAFARLRVPIGYPIHFIGGKSKKARQALARSNKSGLYVLPYSYLSIRDAHDLIYWIEPTTIVCDECHYLANRDSARTKRLMRYIDERQPKGVCLSGTVTNKGIREYHHLIRWCLGNRNPLPNVATLAAEWGSVIDAEADEGGGDGASGPLMPLISWARRHFPSMDFPESREGFRAAFKIRKRTTEGVVSSGDADIGTSLIYHNEPVKHPEQSPGWAELEELVRKVNDAWLTPNDDEIEHAIHKWKWLDELTAGFYNQLSWPEKGQFAERRRISENEAEDVLTRAQLHHAAGQEYAKALRKWLSENAKPNLDTPLLVGQDMSRNGPKNVGSELFGIWSEWKALDFENRPERDATAVRVCPYKVNAAVEWASGVVKDRLGGIIWVRHVEMGRWVYEALLEAGLPTLYCPAGNQHNVTIADPENVDKIVVASMTAHGTGKNLQHFERQLFLQWPRPAKMAEQVVGRTHRSGQKADELVVCMMHTTPHDEINFAACLNDALYIHQTTGNRQKLIYGTHDPLPRIFPSEVLKEHGAQNIVLSRDQEAMMKERFGQ